MISSLTTKSMKYQCCWFSFYFFEHSKLTPLTLPYPVFLHFLDSLWPIESIKIIDESICIFGNLEYPLTKSSFLDTSSTPVTGIESCHFFVGESRLTTRAIVNRKILLIGKSSLEKLQKNPLSPLVIFWTRRIYHTIPII